MKWLYCWVLVDNNGYVILGHRMDCGFGIGVICNEHLRPAGSAFHHYTCTLLNGAILCVSSRLHLLLISAS